MSHPHHEHRAHKVEKARVGHILRHYAQGGAVHHDDESDDKSLVRKMVKKRALKMDGGKVRHRSDRMARARGGRTNKKGTNVTVVVAPQGGNGHPVPVPVHPPMAGPPPGAPPPMPVARPPMAGPPPGGPMPPGIPPGMPMRARGGAIKSGPAWKEGLQAGTPVEHSPGKNDLKDIGRGRPVTYASGGSVRKLVQFYAGGAVRRARGGKIEASDSVDPATRLPGGSGGGEARLVKERRAKRENRPSSAISS